jgi:hypothetical protein
MQGLSTTLILGQSEGLLSDASRLPFRFAPRVVDHCFG